jgi:hypothetical protein
MNNAIKYGYKFEVFKGYTFEKGDLFSEYVNKMYALRKQYNKAHPMNMIAKLLMNSLYGKCGQKLEHTKVSIITKDAILGLLSESISNIIKLANHYVVVESIPANIKYDARLDMYSGVDVNIAIASAVTSYARVVMSAVKNNPLFNFLYSDTDSAVIDQPLPEAMVGGELGQFKKEHEIDQAVFLAPKVYGIRDTNGQQVIKVKGIKDEISSTLKLEDLEELLEQDQVRVFNQEKWETKLLQGKISVKEQAYSLRVTSNKRKAIYNSKGVFFDTRPYNYGEI